MIVKVIQHNSMPSSVAYLYNKAENDSRNTGGHQKYLPNPTKDDFMYALEHLMVMRSDLTGRDLTVNNQIQHLVLSCHASDSLQFDIQKDKILKDLFKELGIIPENQLVNVFVHNDKAHPHLHVLFSRIGEDLTVYEDGNIGKRMGEFSERISKQYGFKFKNEEVKISISQRHLYKPTEKGNLLKLIDFAVKEAEHLTDFRGILKKNGVVARFTSDDKVIYMTPNPLLAPKEEVPLIIEKLRLKQLSREKFKKELSKFGIDVKWNSEGKEIFSRQNYKFWHEDKLPKEVKISQLYNQIRTKKHDPKYLEVREILAKGIESCETLGQIKALLPGSELRYQQKGSSIFNITIEHQDMLIHLHEVFTKEISFDNTHYGNDTWQIPIIFHPRYYNKDAAEWEKMQQMTLKKSRKNLFKL